jgi:hypothetical protein
MTEPKAPRTLDEIIKNKDVEPTTANELRAAGAMVVPAGVQYEDEDREMGADFYARVQQSNLSSEDIATIKMLSDAYHKNIITAKDGKRYIKSADGYREV